MLHSLDRQLVTLSGIGFASAPDMDTLYDLTVPTLPMQRAVLEDSQDPQGGATQSVAYKPDEPSYSWLYALVGGSVLVGGGLLIYSATR